MGFRDDYVTCLFTNVGMIRIPSGKYRQRFGIPRKVWPYKTKGVTQLIDNYYYEWEKQLGPEGYAQFLETVRGRDLPIEAYEIAGDFDSDNLTWKTGAMMNVYIRGHGVQNMPMQTWRFNCYEGDKLYLSNGSLYWSTAYP